MKNLGKMTFRLVVVALILVLALLWPAPRRIRQRYAIPLVTLRNLMKPSLSTAKD